MSYHDLGLLLVQILVILVFSRICALVLKAIGQPRVVGEMIAGIVLGRSVLGLIWPEGFAQLFPPASMPKLFLLAQAGLLLFMFVVGLHIKIGELRSRAPAAILISNVSIALPFALGALTAFAIYQHYGPTQFSFTSFALFMGIAMSITAFPVLARILQEKQMTSTPLGTMALTCAAVDDVSAWCILAGILGIVKSGTMAGALLILLRTIVFILFMWFAVRPFLAWSLGRNSPLKYGKVLLMFATACASAAATEWIGVHALFGAFLAGAIMPADREFGTQLIEKIQNFSSLVLLPIFFAYTGIRLQAGLLNSGHAWLICAAVIVAAVLGKMAGSALAARASGMPWRESWALGALMNTRGLMELVVLNIGYDLGILSPTVFAMMVIMAIFTTAMTGPLVTLILRK